MDLDNALPSIRDIFLDKEQTTLFFFEIALEARIEKDKAHMINSGFYRGEAVDAIRKILGGKQEKCIETIFKHSGSPIETIFLNTLNMLSLVQMGMLGIEFGFSDEPATESVTSFRQFINHATELYADHVQKNGLEYWEVSSVDNFLDSVSRSQLVIGKPINDLRNFIIPYEILGLKNSYHAMLQAKFPEVKVESKSIRVDLYIWVPSDPTFNLVVECDGYKIHSDKKAFTRDRKRDRALKNEGFEVLRFSGTEIYHDFVRSAEELIAYLLKKEEERGAIQQSDLGWVYPSRNQNM